MKINCPNCFVEVEYIEGDCEICSECGNELKAVEIQDSIEKRLMGVEPGISFNVKTLSEKLADQEWNLTEKSRKFTDDIENTKSDETHVSECSCLKVEYNHNLFFLTGSISVIKLKLTPLDDQLQDLLIFMESEHGEIRTGKQIEVKKILKKDRAFVLRVPFNPTEKSGRMVLNFYIGCKINDSFIYYQFSVEHKVYDSKQSGSSLCDQITINQEFTSNHAADINYRDSIGDALKKMVEKTLTANEMIDRLNDLPEKYKLQILTRTTWRPEDILIKGNLYPAKKLMLEYNEKTIFLLSDPLIKLGRDPDQVDLLVRRGQGRMGMREYPNSTVSRKHAEILYCKNDVKLFDFSTWGTYVNGRKTDSCGISLDLNTNVDFGDICWKMNIQRCSAPLPHNICRTCPANEVKSVTCTIDAEDPEPEYYLFVWQCCELGRIIKDLTDWTVFTRNGFFFIRTPEQDFYHLRPGQTISSTNKQIKIKHFEQN